jgi:hypothetical protein
MEENNIVITPKILYESCQELNRKIDKQDEKIEKYREENDRKIEENRKDNDAKIEAIRTETNANFQQLRAEVLQDRKSTADNFSDVRKTLPFSLSF